MRSSAFPLLAAVAAGLLLYGCSTDEPTSPNSPSGATAEALLPVAYTHVRDSDGGAPGTGVEVTLLFEPNGVAQLYVAGATDAIAYKGTYGYNSGKLSLKFSDADFKPDVSVALDTAQGSITLPFKVFSEGTGTSSWQRKRVLPQHTFSAIFKAALINENLTVDGALDRVVAYANAVIRATTASKGVMAKTAADGPTLTGVQKTPNGVRVQYDNGTWNNILLYSWPTGQNGAPLQPGPLASDPRVHLDPESPKNPTSDPTNKTALIIAPFESLKFYSWLDIFKAGAGISPSEGYHYSGSENFEFGKMEDVLEDRDYTVKQLLNDDATVTNMVKELASANGAPGFITINTHGHSDGSLTSSTFLGSAQPAGGMALKNFPAYIEERDALVAAGYGDLLTYGGGTADAPLTLAWTAIERDLRPGTYSYFLTITPKFWEWLRVRKGVKFDRSLVYIGCCLTDATPDLRDAIGARAHLAFNIPVRPELAGATFQYLCRSLSRPTHSAEESYYNILRIANTRQMIYAEDQLFNGLTSQTGQSQQITMKDILNGYAFDGSTMVSYQSAGWLKTANADPGAIWWLLFSGRWGQKAQEGSDGMRACWQSLWKDGKTGGLADPGCHNKAPGRAPTEPEVAYASYLLNGLPAIGNGSLQRIPRWTLNDGR